MRPWLATPTLTRTRIGVAMGVALATDAVQLCLGPLGWTFADEILDVIAMVLTSIAIGFHPLLLPTFVVELIPIADMLPTWTACTAAVIVLRKRSLAQPPLIPPIVTASPPEPSAAQVSPPKEPPRLSA